MTEIKINGTTYRQQTRKCGNKRCKCYTGEGHGPYWYAYSDGSAPKYIGVNLPEVVTGHVAKLKSSLGKIRKLRGEIEKQSTSFYEKYTKAERQLRALRSLETGDYVGSQVLVELGLGDLVLSGPRSGK